MSFAVELRKVRDQELPVQHRVRAMAHCVEMYSPIGYVATWEYLAGDNAGDRVADRSMLLPSIERVVASRQLSKSLMLEFAARRRVEKSDGRRTPKHREVTPMFPPRWHGDEQAGARAALNAWRRREPRDARSSHPVVDERMDEIAAILRLAADHQDGDGSDKSEVSDQLRSIFAELDYRIRGLDRFIDPGQSFRSWELRRATLNCLIALNGWPCRVSV